MAPTCVRSPGFVLTAVALLAATGAAARTDPPSPRVKVTVRDEQKLEEIQPSLPIDERNLIPNLRAMNMQWGLTVDNKRLSFSEGSIVTTFRVNGRSFFPAGNALAKPLGKGPMGKARRGFETAVVQDGIRFTQTIEVVPGRPAGKPAPGQKRRLDTVLVRYLVENKRNETANVGVRVRIDTYNVDNDGCLFAVPNQPNKILNGVELKGKKQVPDYVMSLQRPNLQNPGNIAYWTFKLGSKFEPPNRCAMTAHGVGDNGWDVQVVQAMGDSDFVMYWDPQKVAANGKRELAYAYGLGLAGNPENEGKVAVSLAGSFEPNKQFTVTALVEDPLPGQTLTLELPDGMERLEGKAMQVVPAPTETGNSIVTWQARVLRTGEFPLRVRSSAGITHTKFITIERP